MRILVVEDNQTTREQLKNMLENESFVVDTAEDGESGSYQARTNEYDAIILDLMLPKKDGCEVCRDIRQAKKTVPILMLSVNSAIEQKVSLLNYGADDYITKPYSFNELLARLRALLRRPKHIEPDILNIDDLELDTHKQKVSRNNRTIYLTRKEFSLLEYLLKHKGKVVSRGMIMEHVWHADTDPFSNTIEAHILNIRRKIDFVKTRRLIHTIPGRGYTIETKD